MPDSIFAPIDNYCERTGPEFWSEPLNAVTNLAFILAGLVGLWLCRRAGAGPFAQFLCWWAVVIGIGSGLFHTVANGLTMYADVIPIILFILLFNWYVLTRFIGLRPLAAIAVLIGFYVVAQGLVALAPESLRAATNGTIGYLPALLGLLAFGVWLAQRGHGAARYLFGGAAIFVVSATFRSIDFAVCDAFPIGTHFLWHTLNGLLLFVLLLSAARYDRASANQA